MATPSPIPDDFALTKAFAEQHRLYVERDECGDAILPGRRGGHLYFANGELCAMWINSKTVLRSRIKALGRWSWVGDMSEGQRDAWVKGIPPENYGSAIRLVQCKRKRIVSPEEHERLIAMGFQKRSTPTVEGPAIGETATIDPSEDTYQPPASSD